MQYVQFIMDSSNNFTGGLHKNPTEANFSSLLSSAVLWIPLLQSFFYLAVRALRISGLVRSHSYLKQRILAISHTLHPRRKSFQCRLSSPDYLRSLSPSHYCSSPETLYRFRTHSSVCCFHQRRIRCFPHGVLTSPRPEWTGLLPRISDRMQSRSHRCRVHSLFHSDRRQTPSAEKTVNSLPASFQNGAGKIILINI